MRTRLGFLVCLLVGVIVCFLFALWSRSQGGVSVSSYYRITLGMSSEDVNSVVGVPPGNYSSRKDIEIVDFWGGSKREGKWVDGETSVWYSDEGRLQVVFDNEGRVVFKMWEQSVDHRPGCLDRIRTGLGL
jgi:hypothetical protein